MYESHAVSNRFRILRSVRARTAVLRENKRDVSLARARVSRGTRLRELLSLAVRRRSRTAEISTADFVNSGRIISAGDIPGNPSAATHFDLPARYTVTRKTHRLIAPHDTRYANPLRYHLRQIVISM